MKPRTASSPTFHQGPGGIRTLVRSAVLFLALLRTGHGAATPPFHPPPKVVIQQNDSQPEDLGPGPWRFQVRKFRDAIPFRAGPQRLGLFLGATNRRAGTSIYDGVVAWVDPDALAIRVQQLPGIPAGQPATLGDTTYLPTHSADAGRLISRDKGGTVRTEFTLAAPLPSMPAIGSVWPGLDGVLHGIAFPGWRNARLFRWRPGEGMPTLLGPLPEIPLQGFVGHLTGSDGGHYAVGRLPVAGIRSALFRLPPDGGVHETVESWQGEGGPPIGVDGDAVVFLRRRVTPQGKTMEELVRHRPGIGTDLVWQAPLAPNLRIVEIAGDSLTNLWCVQTVGSEEVPAQFLARFDVETGTWVTIAPQYPRQMNHLAVVGDRAWAYDGPFYTLSVADKDGFTQHFTEMAISLTDGVPETVPSPGPDGRLHGSVPPLSRNGVGRYYSLDPDTGAFHGGPSADDLAAFGQVPSDNVVFDSTGRVVGALWDRATGTLHVVSFEPDGSGLRREHTAGHPVEVPSPPGLQLLPTVDSRIRVFVRPVVGPGLTHCVEVSPATGTARTVWTGSADGISWAGAVPVPGRGVLVLGHEPNALPPGWILRADWIPTDAREVMPQRITWPGALPPLALFAGTRANSAPVFDRVRGRVLAAIESWGSYHPDGTPIPDGPHLAELVIDPETDEVSINLIQSTPRLTALQSRSGPGLLGIFPSGDQRIPASVGVLYPDQGHSVQVLGALVGPHSVGDMGGDLLHLHRKYDDTVDLHVTPGPLEAPVKLGQPVDGWTTRAREPFTFPIGSVFTVPPRAPSPRYSASGLPPGIDLTSEGTLSGETRRPGGYDIELVAEAFGDPTWMVTNRFRWQVDPLPVRLEAASHETVVGHLGFMPQLVQIGGPPLPLAHRLTAGPESPPGIYQIVPYTPAGPAELEGIDLQIFPGVLRLVPDAPRFETSTGPDGEVVLRLVHPAGPNRRIWIEYGPDPVIGPWTFLGEGTSNQQQALEWLLPPSPTGADRFFRIQVSEVAP